MIRILWRLTRGYRLQPWRSPYLRWRIETYWGWHAEHITFPQFWKFAWLQRRELMRYVKWAAQMEAEMRRPSAPAKNNEQAATCAE